MKIVTHIHERYTFDWKNLIYKNPCRARWKNSILPNIDNYTSQSIYATKNESDYSWFWKYFKDYNIESDNKGIYFCLKDTSSITLKSLYFDYYLQVKTDRSPRLKINSDRIFSFLFYLFIAFTAIFNLLVNLISIFEQNYLLLWILIYALLWTLLQFLVF
jgi:hypothetical protein